MAYSLVQLQAYFKNANGGVDPTAAQNQILLSYVNQNSTSLITDAQALQSTIDLASDTTTAVSVQTYQFFLQFAPSAEGLAALNKAYAAGGAQANLNGENRYIAQSVALALQNPTAKGTFSAAYGSLTQAEAATQAYNVIVGSTAATAAGINIANAVAFLTSASSIAYYTAFVKANVPGLATADVDLAVKAAIVGEIIYQATIFNNGAGVGSYATVTNNLVKDLADDGILTFNNVAGIDLFGSYGVKQTPQTLILTDKADALNGGSGDDIFIGTNLTVSAADVLQGGSGVDALTYSSSGAGAVVQAGFKSAGIEVFQITSDAVQGTTFDVSNSTDVNSLINDNSSSDLTLVGLNAVTAVTVRNTSTPVVGAGATGTTNTTIQYTAAAVAGATTTQALVLENVYNPAVGVTGVGSDKTTVTANGVEIFNVTGGGASGSHLTALVSNSLTTVNIDGAQSVQIDALTFAANASGTLTGTVNGAKNTGGINVTLTNSNNADVTVTGGTGADRADFSAGFDAKDSFDGGAGNDTLVLANGLATTTAAGKVSNVETLEVSGGGNGTVDLSKFAGVQNVVVTSAHAGVPGNSLAGAFGLSNVTSTSSLTLDAGAAGTAQNIAVAIGSANTAADVTTVNINKVGANDAVGNVALTNIETLNLNLADDTTVPGTGVLAAGTVGGAAVKTINLTSNIDLTAGNVGGAALTSFDANTATGKLNLANGITTALTGATVKLGAGDDVVTIAATAGTATGGDTITLGAGKDTIVYTGLAQSGDKTTDTITDFKQGEDRLDLTGLVGSGGQGTGILANAQFLGTRASFGLAQGALTTALDGLQAVFQADTNTLWVDLDSNGQLDANDFRIVLSGVTALTAADLGLALTGNTITLSAPAATVSTTVNTNADNKATADNDTINSSIANLSGSNLNAGLGATDTLVLTTAGTVALNNGSTGGTLANIESVTLANGTNTVTVAASSALKNVTGGTGADTVTITNLVAGGAIDLGTGADTLNAVTKAFVETTGATISGGGSGIGTVGGVDIDTINVAGAVTGTLDLTKVSNFEVVNVTLAGATSIQGATATTDGLASGVATLTTTGAAATIVTTVAKLDAITTSTAGTSNTYNLTNAGSFSLVDTAITGTHSFVLFTGTNSVTVDTLLKASQVDGTAGTADTIVVAADLTAGGAQNLATTGIENVTVSTAQTAGNALTINATSTVNASVGGNFTLAAATIYNGSGAGAQVVIGANVATAYNTSGSAATTITGNANVDTLTHSGTGTVTIDAGAGADIANVTGNGALKYTGGTGIDTVTLSATSGSVDSISFAGAGTGIVAATDRDVVNNFVAANDTIVLDIDQTTATTATGLAAVLQVVGTAGAFTAANTADVTVLNYDQAGAVNVLAGVLDGAALLANAGAITVAAAQVGYLVAYDAGNAYLYSFTNNGDTTLAQGEIALIGTFNGVAVGALGGANFTTL